VTDFLYMNLVVFHTGIFNLADVSITTGIIVILINVYLQKPTTPPSPKTAS
jgi:signal peptidase II